MTDDEMEEHKRFSDFELGKLRSDMDTSVSFQKEFYREFKRHAAQEEADRAKQSERDEKQTAALHKLSKSVDNINDRITIVDEFNSTISAMSKLKRVILAVIAALMTLLTAITATVGHFKGWFK